MYLAMYTMFANARGVLFFWSSREFFQPHAHGCFISMPSFEPKKKEGIGGTLFRSKKTFC